MKMKLYFFILIAIIIISVTELSAQSKLNPGFDPVEYGYSEIINSETLIPYLFKNHMIEPYYFLLNKIYFGK